MMPTFIYGLLGVLLLVDNSFIPASGQTTYGHPASEINPNTETTAHNYTYQIVIPDKYVVFGSDGKILDFSYFSRYDIWNNKLQLVRLKFDTQRGRYVIKGLSGWIDTGYTNGYSGWKAVEIPNYYLSVLKGEVLGFMFSKVVTVPYHQVELWKSFRSYSNIDSSYICDRSKLYEFLDYRGVALLEGSTLVPNRLENECRVYSYHYSYLAENGYLNQTLQYEFGYDWYNGRPHYLIKSYIVDEVERVVKIGDTLRWNFTAPARAGVDSKNPVVVFRLMTAPHGYEKTRADGDGVYCDNGGVELTDGDGTSMLSICSDTSNKWDQVYSLTGTLLVKVSSGERRLNFHAEVHAGTAEDAPKGYYDKFVEKTSTAVDLPWNYISIGLAAFIIIVFPACFVYHCAKKHSAIGVIKDEDRRRLQLRNYPEGFDEDEEGILDDEMPPDGTAVMPALPNNARRLPPIRRASQLAPLEGPGQWGMPMEMYPWGPPPSYRETIAEGTETAQGEGQATGGQASARERGEGEGATTTGAQSGDRGEVAPPSGRRQQAADGEQRREAAQARLGTGQAEINQYEDGTDAETTADSSDSSAAACEAETSDDCVSQRSGSDQSEESSAHGSGCSAEGESLRETDASSIETSGKHDEPTTPETQLSGSASLEPGDVMGGVTGRPRRSDRRLERIQKPGDTADVVYTPDGSDGGQNSERVNEEDRSADRSPAASKSPTRGRWSAAIPQSAVYIEPAVQS